MDLLFFFFSIVVYEILLDKYWGSIDTRKEGIFYLLHKQNIMF